MRETRMLAQFVAETRFHDLPDGLIEECKIAVLDALAADFIGTAQPWSQRVLVMLQRLGGSPEATVINQPWRTDISRAAFANGVLIGAFECEPLTGSHASGTVLPAALAVSQRQCLDGPAFLTALAVGFEISARIAHTAIGLETGRRQCRPPGVCLYWSRHQTSQRYTASCLSGANASTIIAAVGELQRQTNMARLAEMLATYR